MDASKLISSQDPGVSGLSFVDRVAGRSSIDFLTVPSRRAARPIRERWIFAEPGSSGLRQRMR